MKIKKNLTRRKKNSKNKIYNLTNKIRSFSPSINNKLLVHSLKTMNPNEIDVCQDLLKIKLLKNGKETCLDYNDNFVKNKLIQNLKASKHIDVKKFISPRQIMSNCWFNTMFVTLFFSDKGRKFFRYFRELMITGKTFEGKEIETDLAKLFFILNLFIEASYNTNKNNSQTKKKTQMSSFYRNLEILSDNLNTNFFIYHIYQIINKTDKMVATDKLLENRLRNFDIPNIKEAGNPLQYYESIFNYLDYQNIRFLKLELNDKEDIDKKLDLLFETDNNIPHIITIEDFQSKSVFKNEYIFKKNGENLKYVLDSIILTNKDHFDPKANSHFVSVLTINKKEYKFDGSSYSRLSQFKWKNMINKDKDWIFKENPNYYPEKYNFTKGYKIMFYYRS